MEFILILIVWSIIGFISVMIFGLIKDYKEWTRKENIVLIILIFPLLSCDYLFCRLLEELEKEEKEDE